MTLWRRLNHVKRLTWLILHLALLALHFAAVIEPVHGTLILPMQGTNSQLTLSSSIQLKTNTPSLVSSNGTFALGFFSSSSNAGRFGLGIWYNINLPPGIQTVVWMPQRDADLSAAASLQLSSSGVLQLIDTVSGTRQVVWSSSNNLPGTVLELQDYGNLVLLNATSSVIWQSFDTPTDTLLPGQVLRATMNRPLVSWRGADDWAKGSYFCAWMPINGTVSLTLYWNGRSIDGWNQSSWSTTNVTIGNDTIYPYLINFPLSDYIYLDRANGSFYAGNESFSSLIMSSASNIQGPLQRVTLDRDGLLRLYSWTVNTNAWEVEGIWAPPGVNGLCAVFAECGPYSLCTLDPSSPAYLATCSCPEDFELIDPHDEFKGCKRKYEIPPGVCAANTTKLKLIKVGEFDFPFASRLYPLAITSETACKQLCLNDCRCAGAVFWRRTGQCYIKSEPLFNGGFPQDIGNHSSYLKVLDSPLYLSSTDRRKVEVIIGTSVGVGAALVCLGMALVVWKCWKRRRIHLQPKFAELGILGVYPRKFTFRELSAATNSFSRSELIGSGGMGSVYKGALKPTGAVVAVKRIRHEARGSEEGFLAEASSISQIRHRNLVQLKGWCIEDGKFLLVYDYMPNGSLDQWLHDHRSEASRQRQRPTAKELSWNLRYSILAQIAAALEYLHEDWQQCVLHRDIKSANVLLNAEFNAYLGDFGLARLIDHQKMEKTTLMAGTLGYMAPELPYTGKATKETDIYSFGVLMLEVVCGEKPVDFSGDEDSLDGPQDVVLLHRVQRAHQEGKLLATVDPRLRITTEPARDGDSDSLSGNRKQSGADHDTADADFSGLSRRMEEIKVREDEQQTLVLKLGLLCCLPHPSARPPMRLVHRILVTGDATAIPALPDTTQWTREWTHHGGFHPRPLQGSMSLSTSSAASFHPVTEVHE